MDVVTDAAPRRTAVRAQTHQERNEVLELADDGLRASAVERRAVERGHVQHEGQEDGRLEVDLQQ